MLPLLLMANVVQAQWTKIDNGVVEANLFRVPSMDIATNGDLYLALKNRNNSRAMVVSYDGSAWDTLGGTDISGANIDYISLVIGKNDTPYVAYSVGSNCIVKKYNGSSWSTVGSSISGGFAMRNPTLAMDTSGLIPYLCYKGSNTSWKASVVRYNGTSWTNVGASGFTPNSIRDQFTFKISSNNTPFIAFEDEVDDNRIRVMKYTSSSWDTLGTLISDSSHLDFFGLVIDNNDTPYIAYEDLNYNENILVRKFNGTSWDTVGTPGFTGGDVYNPLLTFAGSNNSLYVFFGDGVNSDRASVMQYNGSGWVDAGTRGFSSFYLSRLAVVSNEEYIYALGLSFTGFGVYRYAIPNVWNSTWSAGTPDSTSNVLISDTSSPGSFNCEYLTIDSGVSLTVNSGDTVRIYGDVFNNGEGFAGIGNFAFTKNGTATISGDTLECNGTILVESSCVLSTGGKLRLTSNASNTGRIGPLAGSITGDVTVEAYIPGRRAFRFMAHPFNDSIALTQLLDDIDITGQGGQNNGFTASASTNPSAFSWEINGTGAWAPYTSPTTRSWDKYELLRILIRGAKGEGLNGQTYTPSATVIDMTGELNQGTHVITLVAGTNSPNYAQVGNPYASPVELSSLSLGSDIGSTAIFWSAQSATRGAYVGQPFAVTFGIPAYASFFASLTGTSSTNIEFEEADKRTGSGTGYFKTTASNHWVELIISDSTHMWDKLFLNFDVNTMNVQDKKDGVKANNPDMDFYTLSADNVELVVDARPYEADKGIPVGLRAYNNHGTYVIRPGVFDIPNGTKVVLHDKYLNVQEDIIPGMEYWFSITSDSNSQGEDRFEINMVGHPTGVITTNNNNAVIQLIPNPARNEVKVSFKALEGKADLALTSVTGQVVYSKQIDAASGSVVVPLTGMPAGLYMVELKGTNASFTQKLIKQ